MDFETEEELESEVNNPHDKGYKRLFKVKKNFLDFIKKYVALGWMLDLEEDDLELVDKEFITDQFDTYESDLVYKVKRDGQDVYLFFLQELQSRNDFTMPFRLLVYMTAIWLDYFKNCDKDVRKRKDFKLPAVIPIVLYNGKSSWTAKTKFREMIQNEQLFGGYLVDFEYILVSVDDISREYIKSTNTLIDNVLYSDQLKDEKAWLTNILQLMQRVRLLDTEDQNAWITWFSKAFRSCNESSRKEFIDRFKMGDDKVCNSMEMLLNEKEDKGRLEGIREGKLEGIREGKLEEVFSSVYEGDYTLQRGAEKLGITIESFTEKYNDWKKRL